MAELFEITPRIQRLRQRYLDSPVGRRVVIPHSYGNHPLTIHWLRAYRDAEETAETTVLRRSIAEAAELRQSACILTEEEWIVGQPDFLAWESDGPEKAEFEQLVREFHMANRVHGDGRSDHMALDYEKLLRVGVEGLMEEIRAQKAALTFTADVIAENIAKEEFYEACLLELEALLDCAENYRQALLEAARNAAPERREELLVMADNLRQVPRSPAKTFWQALQSIHFYTFTLRGLYSAGRPDRLLLPYYEADLAAGRLTPAFAQQLIENYCMLYTTYVYPYTAAGMMIGGTDESGNTVENPLTWAFLQAVDHIEMPDPNLGLCVTEHTGEELLRYAMDMIGRGRSFPSFWNDAAVVRGMLRNGFAPQDAHNYVNSTCVELTVIGKSSMWTTAPYHNLAQLLLDVLNGSTDYPDYESLENAYFAHVRQAFAVENHRLNRLKLERARNASEPMRHSCLVSDCIARGKPVGQGGAVYSATLPNVLGFANAVDGLSAIRQLVYGTGEVTIAELRAALANDFAEAEPLRQQLLRRAPHYGNGDESADAIAAALAACMSEACRDLLTYHGDRVIPGNFSYNYHALYGSRTGATPDGRHAGLPLSDSAGPAQGRDTQSPTAALRSGTCWPQSEFLGGVAQNLRLSRRYFRDPSMTVPLSLLRGYFARGGCELQLNCVDADTLRAAQQHPEQYENLLVRVGGYSDYFVRLTPEQQQEITERTDYQ